MSLPLGERQHRDGEGPCLTAAQGQVVEVVDTRTDQRWPAYMAAAVEQGCLSSLAAPLLRAERDRLSGALSIYACTVDAFDSSRDRVTRFAACAGVAVANMHAHQAEVRRGDHLESALESRAVIDQAEGILMERCKITADQAFRTMATLSMAHNIKVREIADHVVRTGELECGPDAH